MLIRLFASLLLLLSMLQTSVAATHQQTLFEHPATAQQLSQLKSQLAIKLPIRGDFTQSRYLKVLSKPLISQGKFIFAQQHGMVWQQVSPFRNSLVMTKTALYSQDSQQQWQKTEINQAGAGAQIAQLLPNVIKALLSGNITAMQQSFKLYIQPNTTGQWQLGLVPKDPLLAKAFKQLILTGKQQLQQLIIISPQQDKTVIDFKQLHSSALTPAEIALFNPMQALNAH